MQKLREYKDMPIKTQLVTVILAKDMTNISFAITREDKIELLEEYRKSGGTLMAVWTGDQCSHAFDLPPEVMEEAFGERKAS
jgi:hypothetical protein